MITEERAVELLQKTAQRIEAGVQDDLEAGDFGGAMASLDAIRDATRWVQGDLINDAKSQYGITTAYRLAAKAMGTNIRWAVELSRVSDIFPPEQRRSDIAWQLYRAASLYDRPWDVLQDAIANGTGANELRLAAPRVRGVKVKSNGTPPTQEQEVIIQS